MRAIDRRTAGAEQQQIVESALVESPVPHRPGVDMDKARMRIPPDAAAPHRAGRFHRLGELRVEAKIKRSPIYVLAVLGHPESRAREHRIGLRRAVGGEDRCLGQADGVENIGKKIDDPDVHLGVNP